MKNEMTADEFKVGDTVWDVAFGKGNVHQVTRDDVFQIKLIVVGFENNKLSTYTFTKNGTYGPDCLRTLFFSEPKVEASVKRPFVSALIGKRVVINISEDICVIGVVEREDSEYLVIDSYTYWKDGLDAIYEITSDNLLES